MQRRGNFHTFEVISSRSRSKHDHLQQRLDEELLKANLKIVKVRDLCLSAMHAPQALQRCINRQLVSPFFQLEEELEKSRLEAKAHCQR
jgi:hypothetical protein